VLSKNISDTDDLGGAISKGNIINFAIGAMIDEPDKSKLIKIKNYITYLDNLGINFDVDFDTKDNDTFYLLKSKGMR